jgi:hypothetical protein
MDVGAGLKTCPEVQCPFISFRPKHGGFSTLWRGKRTDLKVYPYVSRVEVDGRKKVQILGGGGVEGVQPTS